jgi:hypothetical protein
MTSQREQRKAQMAAAAARAMIRETTENPGAVMDRLRRDREQ